MVLLLIFSADVRKFVDVWSMSNSWIKQKAGSPKYTIARINEKGAFYFGSDPVGIKLCLDRRYELNIALKTIVVMYRPNISAELYAKLLHCEATSCCVERSFNMLGKLLAKNYHFSADNVWKI